MRIRLLGRVVDRGRAAMCVTIGVITARWVIDFVTRRAEQAADEVSRAGGSPDARSRKRLLVLRVARGVAHLL